MHLPTHFEKNWQLAILSEGPYPSTDNDGLVEDRKSCYAFETVDLLIVEESRMFQPQEKAMVESHLRARNRPYTVNYLLKTDP